uniref:Uncharacterized protein n=1 Tax=Zea mays TaxID=4577 RepID=C0PC71_MAIZE|nr:unknown [Zea mays]
MRCEEMPSWCQSGLLVTAGALCVALVPREGRREVRGRLAASGLPGRRRVEAVGLSGVTCA